MSTLAPAHTSISVGDEDTLPGLLRIFRERRWIVAVAFILTTGAAAVLSLAMPPVYEASTTLISDSTPPVVLFANTGQESNLLREQVGQAPDVSTFTEIVKSQAVRDAAAARLSLLLGPEKSRDVLAHVTVQKLRDTAIVRISAASGDPDAATTAANALAQSVVDLDLKARRRLVAGARKFIGEQLEITRRKLQTSEEMVTAFRNRNGDVSLSEQTLLNLRKLTDLEARLAEVRLQKQEAETGVVPLTFPTTAVPAASSDAQTGSGPAASSDAQTGNSPAASSDAQTGSGLTASSDTKTGSSTLVRSGPEPLVSALQSQLNSLEVELSGLLKQFTPLHPQVISTQARIDETKRRLRAAVALNRADLATREQGLSASIGQVEQTLMRIPTREAQLARLTRNAREAERTYLLLSEQFQGARIFEGSIGSAVRILDAARRPAKPARPNRPLNIVLGAVVGLMLGITGAYVIEQLDDCVRSAEEASRLLGAPVLGVIPRLRRGGRQAGVALPLLVPSAAASASAEQFRALRTHILGAMRPAREKCLLITSALSGEGRSTIAANLAIAIAQSARSVWLVDCDLRHPRLKDLFPEANSPGLSAVLTGQAVVKDVVRVTRQPFLDCVVAGSPVSNPVELLDSKPMAGFLRAARDLADAIVLDSPAMLPVADAEVLGLYVDGAVMVVRARRTDRRALVHARERLERARVRLIGVVLNDSRGRSPWRSG